MASRKIQLLVTLEAELLEDSWTEANLRKSVADYLKYLIGVSEARLAGRFIPRSYRLADDTVIVQPSENGKLQ